MKTIVAPTDFSAISLNAVNYAADLAIATNANLSLLHVCQVPMTFSEVPVTAYNIDDLVKGAEEIFSQLKKDILKRKEYKLEVHTTVRAGFVASEIEKFCASINPYSIVMGTQGAGAVERFFFGSNTIFAMKNFSYPLIVVPLEAKFTNIKKIGLACDLKRIAECMPVQEIKKLVKEFNAELHVLHVNTENEPAYIPEIIRESGLLQKMLSDLNPVYHFLNNVNIDEGLSEYAEKNDLDLLIVIPKKYSLIEKMLHKSHAKKLILHTHIPIMSVHE